jgi:hypothetical protein
VRNKPTNNAFVPIAFLPIVNFDCADDLKSTLQLRLRHLCLDIVTASLKDAAANGAELVDPDRNVRDCYTPLAAYLADLEEGWDLSALKRMQSIVTVASKAQLGSPLRQPT